MSDEVLEMGRPKNQLETQHKYEKANYDQIALRFRKIDKIIPLLNIATTITGRTKNEYVKQALLTQFKSDGITLDQLPSSSTLPQSEPKKPKRYMIYMITECYAIFDETDLSEEKYIATFPTLNAAEKYARNKFDKKAYPIDWRYTIWGRYIEGNNKLEACNTLKAIIRKELEEDRINGVGNDEYNYLERINEEYPIDYCDKILYEGDNTKSEFDFQLEDD